MSERKRVDDARGYRMRKRADDIAKTRQRIIEAAVRLHGTIGPAATTTSALAEEAGATRLTVNRHFPEGRALFSACSAHWAASQVLPNPDAWKAVDDPQQRLRIGLTDIYRFYRDAEPMLTNVRRDRAALPAEIRDRTSATDGRHRDVLLQPFAARGSLRRQLCAILGHAVSFWTWRSLCLDQGLSDREAVEAMTSLVTALAGPAHRTPTPARARPQPMGMDVP